jgi:hypothetical protein
MPGKRHKAASRQNSDARQLMGPPPPVQLVDGVPVGLPALRMHCPSPLGCPPTKASTSAPAVPVSHIVLIIMIIAECNDVDIMQNFIYGTSGRVAYWCSARCIKCVRLQQLH